MITHLPDQRSTIEHYSGELQASPEMYFGRAGKLSPKSWRLTVTKIQLPTSATASVQYDLTLEAEIPNDNYGKVLGHFGYPKSGEMDDYSYGYGSSGYLADLPSEILSTVKNVTGIHHFLPTEEVFYEYSYSLLEESSTPKEWFASIDEAKAALIASGLASEAHCFFRREKSKLEVFQP